MTATIHKINYPSISPIQLTNKEYLYSLNDNLKLQYEYEGAQFQYTVPQGFVTDGASIPRLLWRIIGSPYQPQFLRAAIIHDKMCHAYDIKKLYTDEDVSEDLKEMSILFYHLLLHNDVPKWKAKAMYYAVYAYKRFF